MEKIQENCISPFTWKAYPVSEKVPHFRKSPPSFLKSLPCLQKRLPSFQKSLTCFLKSFPKRRHGKAGRPPMFNIQKWFRSRAFFQCKCETFSLSRHRIWRMRMADWMRLWVQISRERKKCSFYIIIFLESQSLPQSAVPMRQILCCVRKSRNGLAPKKKHET